jgi:hypothetical protein
MRIIRIIFYCLILLYVVWVQVIPRVFPEGIYSAENLSRNSWVFWGLIPGILLFAFVEWGDWWKRKRLDEWRASLFDGRVPEPPDSPAVGAILVKPMEFSWNMTIGVLADLANRGFLGIREKERDPSTSEFYDLILKRDNPGVLRDFEKNLLQILFGDSTAVCDISAVSVKHGSLAEAVGELIQMLEKTGILDARKRRSWIGLAVALGIGIPAGICLGTCVALLPFPADTPFGSGLQTFLIITAIALMALPVLLFMISILLFYLDLGWFSLLTKTGYSETKKWKVLKEQLYDIVKGDRDVECAEQVRSLLPYAIAFDYFEGWVHRFYCRNPLGFSRRMVNNLFVYRQTTLWASDCRNHPLPEWFQPLPGSDARRSFSSALSRMIYLRDVR